MGHYRDSAEQAAEGRPLIQSVVEVDVALAIKALRPRQATIPRMRSEISGFAPLIRPEI